METKQDEIKFVWQFYFKLKGIKAVYRDSHANIKTTQ